MATLPPLLLKLHLQQSVGANPGDDHDDDDDDYLESRRKRQKLEEVLETATKLSTEDLRNLTGSVQDLLARRKAAADLMRAQDKKAFDRLKVDELQLVFEILSAEDCRDVGSLCSVNKSMAEVCSQQKILWQLLCERLNTKPYPFNNAGFRQSYMNDTLEGWRDEFIRKCRWRGPFVEDLTIPLEDILLTAVEGDTLVTVTHDSESDQPTVAVTKLQQDVEKQSQSRVELQIPALTFFGSTQFVQVSCVVMDEEQKLLFVGYGNPSAVFPGIHMIDYEERPTRMLPTELMFEDQDPRICNAMAVGTMRLRVGQDPVRVLVAVRENDERNISLFLAQRSEESDALPPWTPDEGFDKVRWPLEVNPGEFAYSTNSDELTGVVVHQDCVAFCGYNLKAERDHFSGYLFPDKRGGSRVHRFRDRGDRYLPLSYLATEGDLILGSGVTYFDRLSKNEVRNFDRVHCEAVYGLRMWKRKPGAGPGEDEVYGEATIIPVYALCPVDVPEGPLIDPRGYFMDPLLSVNGGFAFCGFGRTLVLLSIQSQSVLQRWTDPERSLFREIVGIGISERRLVVARVARRPAEREVTVRVWQ